MGLVRAKTASAVELGNGHAVVISPDALYEDDDPLVRKHPDLFEPVRATHSSRPVEQATAAPGERRNVRRQ